MRYIVLIISISITMCSWSQNKPHTALAEELVAIVGNSPVMLSDVERTTMAVIEHRKRMGVNSDQTPREEAIEMLLLQKLMAAQAQADSLDKDLNREAILQNVQQTIKQMTDEAGSVKELEKKYGKAIFQISKDIENQLVEQELAQSMTRKVRDLTKLTPYDVETFFNRIPSDSLPLVPAQYIYAQIVRTPPNTEERKYKVREQLLEFRNRVLNGGEKLSVLARLYSQDPGSKNQGGEYPMQPIQSLVGPFAEVLDGLKPGQISEIVETQYGFHIMELISRKGDMVQYRHLLLKPEFTAEETQKVEHELDSLATAIREGKISFAAAALRFSDDQESKYNGGKVYNLQAYMQTRDISRASTKFVADEIDVLDNRKLSKMKVGDISEPYESIDIKGNRVYKIITLQQIIPAHIASLEQDFDQVAEVALMDKQNKDSENWINKAIGKMYIYISPEYRTVQYQRPQWLATCAAQEENRVALKIPKGVFDKAIVHHNQEETDDAEVTTENDHRDSQATTKQKKNAKNQKNKTPNKEQKNGKGSK